MFSKNLHEFITACSDYLIDGRRIGNLIVSNHRYSAQELLQRGLIITCTAVAGFLEQRRQDDYRVGPFVLGASLGFVLSHGIVIAPLVYKRWSIKNECSSEVAEIRDLLVLKPAQQKAQVDLMIKEIMHLEGKSASAVWGKRLRLLQVLKDYASSAKYDPEIELNALDGVNNVPSFSF